MKAHLSDILSPWLESLNLPAKIYTTDWDVTLRGKSHWYTRCRKLSRLAPDVDPEEVIEDWVMTVQADHVQVRSEADDAITVIHWIMIDAADPEFCSKLETALRAALAYLAGT